MNNYKIPDDFDETLLKILDIELSLGNKIIGVDKDKRGSVYILISEAPHFQEVLNIRQLEKPDDYSEYIKNSSNIIQGYNNPKTIKVDHNIEHRSNKPITDLISNNLLPIYLLETEQFFNQAYSVRLWPWVHNAERSLEIFMKYAFHNQKINEVVDLDCVEYIRIPGDGAHYGPIERYRCKETNQYMSASPNDKMHYKEAKEKGLI